jgi:hypothetical protein
VFSFGPAPGLPSERGGAYGTRYSDLPMSACRRRPSVPRSGSSGPHFAKSLDAKPSGRPKRCLRRSESLLWAFVAPSSRRPEHGRFTNAHLLGDLPPRQARFSQCYQLQEIDLTLCPPLLINQQHCQWFGCISTAPTIFLHRVKQKFRSAFPFLVYK